MNIYKIKNSYLLKSLIITLMATFFAVFVLAMGNDTQVGATTAAELKAKADAIAAEQAANEAVLDDLEDDIDSLENKLSYLSTQIHQINLEIEATNVEIDRLSLALQKAEKELARQKSILAESLRTLYIEGDVTTLDLILASEGFSDFINQQEYLSSLKKGVEESTIQVIALKEEITDNKIKQEELLEEQKAQKKELKNNQDEQQALLNATKGQENLYQGIVADLEKQRQQAEKELEDFLAAQNFVSLGWVNQGDVIGYMGNTGFSTGPHLHFAVFKNGSTVDPWLGGTAIIDGFIWPTESTRVTQPYGCGAPYYWYAIKCSDGTSKHTGLDIGAVVSGVSGDLIYAAGSGDIVLREYSGGFGNLVVIDHGGGTLTYYGHLRD